jgi:peptidoglycan/xylan/chitin deacetylase (PgdA/CDA1 family)
MTEEWFPEGKRAAISLSFDDARLSQADEGLPLFQRLGMRATFYVSLAAAEKRRDAWRQAIAEGHEIGNHTVSHPCSGNFPFARRRALEDYTLGQMEAELLDANDRIEQMLGVRPTTFAYPCGQTYVGRGEGLHSYIPLVAKHFLAGRLFMSEWHNDVSYCDLAQVFGISSDNHDFETIQPLLDAAVQDGGWMVLAGHEIGSQVARQTTRIGMLEALARYCEQRPEIWVDTVANVAAHAKASRAKSGQAVASRE